MKKHFNNSICDISNGNVSEEELALINKHTLIPIEAENVFCFTVTLCDNEIDRDLQRFSIDALEKLADMFIGKTGIADHQMKTENQSSRIFKTWIEKSETEFNCAGEPYTALKARAYMPITPGSQELIAQISAGIKKETSISCSMQKESCSICGSDLRKGACKHRKGQKYSGKTCHGVLAEPSDAYEFSFVAVPAQPRAGVTKAFEAEDSMTAAEIAAKSVGFETVTLSVEAFGKLTNKLKALEEQAEDAKCFRSSLEAQVTRLAAMAVPSLASEEFGQICKSLTSPQLISLQKAFEEKAAKLYPLAPQLGTKTEKETNNNEFLI